nr:PREDICTED: Na(+)/H(+) exchange regulatory cofactor NHE-RF4 [Latimeria chalumnae]|eukprot:XP_014350402.1 PREDICTED: Na(+)/H(+) exchange regulatory cofactor NHE-RF4 [Latimeria chalumnae]
MEISFFNSCFFSLTGFEDQAGLTLKFQFNPKLGIDNPALSISDDIGNFPKLRVCLLRKKEGESFGFYLRQELGKEGHIIRMVEPMSPAEFSGLREGDRLMEVNGDSMDTMEHFKVVQKIKASGQQVMFTVLDGTAYVDAKARKLDVAELVQSEIGESCAKPRLCYIIKDKNRFGFNLSSRKGMKGKFTLNVTSGGPAERSGVHIGDILIEINGVNVTHCTSSQVIRKIKESGEKVAVLVIDSKSEMCYRNKGINISSCMADISNIPFKPRKLYLVKGPDGFGFLLRQEKLPSGKKGHILRDLNAGSPAEKSGMQEGDHVLAVNGDSVEELEHEDVVHRIRRSGNQVTLLAIDPKGDEFYTGVGLSPLLFYEDDIPASPRGCIQTDFLESQAKMVTPTSPPQKKRDSLSQPRLCHLTRGPTGYGFHLHSICDEPGTFVKQVVSDGPAAQAGLKDGDVVVEVNGQNVEVESCEEVAVKMKAGGHHLEVLVADREAYFFYKQKNIIFRNYKARGGESDAVINCNSKPVNHISYNTDVSIMCI